MITSSIKEGLWEKYYMGAEAVPRAIQNSKESIAKLSERYHLNPKTIIKWKKRSFTKKVSAKYLQSKKSVI